MNKASRPAPRMYSRAELATLWSTSVKTIDRRIESGELRAHRLGRQVRISEEDAINYINANRA